jgi:hypothetical protein
MNKIDTKYYEETDFSDLIKNTKSKTIHKVKPKRITINISEDIFSKAHNLDIYMNMGYQNVLKTAIFLGLKDLSRYIIERKDISKLIKKK